MPANMHAIRYADDSKYFLGRYLLWAADHENSFATAFRFRICHIRSDCPLPSTTGSGASGKPSDNGGRLQQTQRDALRQRYPFGLR